MRAKIFLETLVVLMAVGYCVSLAAGAVDTEQFPVKKTVNSLGKIKVKSDETEIPKKDRPLLKLLKLQLRDLVNNALNDQHLKWEAPMEIQREVLKELKKEGVKVEEPKQVMVDKPSDIPRYYRYGEIYKIECLSIPDNSNLIVLTTTLGNSCGDDTSFYIFSKNGENWRPIFTEEAGEYSLVNAAQGSFGYAVLKSKDKDYLLVTTVNITPWCSSWWQGINYRLYRIDLKTFESKILLNKNDIIWLGKTPPYKLIPGLNTFTLKFYGGKNMLDVNEDGTAKFQSIMYIVKGDRVLKTQ